MSDIVEIASFASSFEAKTASLASEGITSSVVTDNAGGTIPSMSLLEGGVRLIVRTEDVERARDVLSAVEEETVDVVGQE